MKKMFIIGLVASLMLIVSCSSSAGGNDGDYSTGTVFPSFDTESNPVVSADRATALDGLFSLDTPGETFIRIKRSEWKQLCENFNDFHENEEYVHCDYAYRKNGKEWILKDCGFRMRGNTTRVIPQGKDKYKAIPKNNWEDGTLAQTDGYRQSHFKVNFEKFTAKDENHKMADYAKGVNLKRFNSDKMYGREIFCYDLFRHYGIFAAPRASYTRMFVQIVEEDNSVLNLDYGVYEMFEDLGKQYVKSHEDKWGEFKEKKASLFKCSWGAFFTPESLNGNIGEDVVTLVRNEDGTVAGTTNRTFCYSFKEGNLDNAKKQLEDFVNGLNNNSTKEWLEEHMDVNLFTRTLAASVLLGMDDDYWGNSNNFYIYFDKDGKLYLIPYDYDNTLGHDIKNPSAYVRNIFQWCEDSEVGRRPLVEKVLAIPEFKKMYLDHLLEISGDDYYLNKSKSRIQGWQSKISPYVKSNDIVYDCDVSDSISNSDWTGNVFDHFGKMRQNVINWSTERKIIFDLNGGTINGSSQSVVKEGTITTFKGLVENPVNGDMFFKGWTLTKNGTDYVSSVTGESTEYTVYAKWADEIIEPVRFTDDGILFTFVPEDWGKTEADRVYCVGYDNDNGWNDGSWHNDNAHLMTKQADGTYTKLVPLDACFGSDSWNLRFVVNDDWIPVSSYRFIDCLYARLIAENGQWVEGDNPKTPVKGNFVSTSMECVVDGAGKIINIFENLIIGEDDKLGDFVRVRFNSYAGGVRDDWTNYNLDGKKIYCNGKIVMRDGCVYAKKESTLDLSKYALTCDGKTFKGWKYWDESTRSYVTVTDSYIVKDSGNYLDACWE